MPQRKFLFVLALSLLLCLLQTEVFASALVPPNYKTEPPGDPANPPGGGQAQDTITAAQSAIQGLIKIGLSCHKVTGAGECKGEEKFIGGECCLELGEKSIINRALNYIFWLSLIIAPLFILIGAFMFATAAGVTEKVQQAKKLILWALIGLAIASSGKFIFSFITHLLGI